MANPKPISRFAFYPTQKAIWILGLGLPLALILSVIFPQLWAIGAAWAAAIIGLVLLDTFLATPVKMMEPTLDAPTRLYVGTDDTITLDFEALSTRIPSRCEFKLTTNDYLAVTPQTLHLSPEKTNRTDRDDHSFAIQFSLIALRRGEALLQRLWSRWQGPLGLIWMQRQDPLDHHLAIIPNIQLVTETAMQFFSRDAIFGQKIQNLKGEGNEFDALAEFLPGMDKRAIDWKHSARHANLLAREYRTERNHNIIFALDSGYLMCEDMVDENATRLTKLDRSITAILIMGYVSLKMGDRVGLFSFDKAPSLYTAPVSGTQQFGGFQNKASQIQYSNEETNYTYGLSFLAQKLRRRSLIVVFTDFVDMTQSELMLETVARLLKRHLIIFVAFRNQPLSDLTTKTVETPSDISQAVIAQNILSERSLVLTRLRRMGVDVLDADPNSLNTDIVNRYLALKAKGAL